jgi:predicted SAM-dependent methyltransferase
MSKLIFRNTFLLTPFKSLKIELKSFLLYRFFYYKNRLFFNDKRKYLNVGSGDKVKKNFVNLDFFRLDFFKAKYYVTDIRKKLFFRDSTFEGVYSSHTLEHLQFNDGINLLKEIYRILKKGGVIRIVVPDLDKYCKFYNKINFRGYSQFKKNYNKNYVAIYELTQNNHHLSTYNFECLKFVLVKCGFKNIKESSCKKSNVKIFSEEEDYNRSWNSLYVEATK